MSSIVNAVPRNGQLTPKCHCASCNSDVFQMDWDESFCICKDCSAQLLPFYSVDDLASLTSDRLHFFKSVNPKLNFRPFTQENDRYNTIDSDNNYFREYDASHSNYYDIENFNQKFERSTVKGLFSNIHFNARSIVKNFDSIKYFLKLLNIQFDVIGISETWLSNSSTLSSINMENYDFVCKNRIDRRGGGVGMYIVNSHNYFQRDDLMLDQDVCDSIFVGTRNF